MISLKNSPPAVWRQHQDLIPYLGLTGQIVSFSKIYSPPPGILSRPPYFLAIISIAKLEKKLAIEITHTRNIKIGQSVELVLRKYKVSERGLISYSIKGIISFR